MAAFIAKQMVGNQLSAVKGKQWLNFCLVLKTVECVSIEIG